MPERQVKPDPFLERKPTIREQCRDAIRPCPWVSCRHHLAVDVDERIGYASTSTVKCNPLLGEEDDILAMPETCSLDVAERGGMTLDEVGQLLGVTRERVRQIELVALTRLRAAARTGRLGIDDE